MKKTIKIICVTAACIFLGLIAYISFAGRKEKNTEQKYSFYYINSEETKLKEEKYTPEKETAEVMLRDFSESLNNRETREDGNFTVSGRRKNFFLFYKGWNSASGI